MILLPAQLQSLAFMVWMGWGYGAIYSLWNRLFYRYRKKNIMLVLEIVFHVCFHAALYYGLFYIQYGIMNLYLWLAFFLGLYIYLRWYSLLFLRFYERCMRFLYATTKPLRIAYSKIFAIIKKIKIKQRRRKDAKKRNRKRKKEKKQ